MNRTDLKETLTIAAGDGAELYGDLVLPADAACLVVFAHGSGSGRHSPRNRQVADVLNAGRCGTLLFDLLTPEEEAADEVSGRLRFDVGMLGRRLAEVTKWLEKFPPTADLAVGYFGASTGAAAALIAAAELPKQVGAVVSRGGRPDLAGPALPRVTAPTLLIVGGADPQVHALNEEAFEELKAPSDLVVIPGAAHLFEEPGALDAVARLALDWFQRYLCPPG